jgi:hypothetical protein
MATLTHGPLSDRIRAAAIARAERRADAAESIADVVDTARAIIRHDGRWTTADDRAEIIADGMDLAYYIVDARTGRVAPWVARAIARTLPPKELAR